MYWKTRAKTYDDTEWAADEPYLEKFVQLCNLWPSDMVLDVGTGTGIVSQAIRPYVRRVYGIDNSIDMLRSGSNAAVHGDARKMGFKDGVFDKVTARMVFHHIVDGLEDAVSECYRVLKRGGLLIVSEAVPPDASLKDWWIEMFKLKEERVVFLPEDILEFMRDAGFVALRYYTYVLPQMSVKEWLASSAVPEPNMGKILDMHRNLDESASKLYNATKTEEDVLIDPNYVIVIGDKI